jgi:hypothetical protein
MTNISGMPLTFLPTWEVFTEEQSKCLSKGTKALPTMAIATIKYDEHNHKSELNIGLLYWET